MMINSVIILISFEHAKQTTNEKEKEKRETFPQKENTNIKSLSLSLSLSVTFRSSFSLSRFLSKNLDENGRGSQKNKKFSSFPHIAFLCCEPRYRENSCLRVLLSRP